MKGLLPLLVVLPLTATAAPADPRCEGGMLLASRHFTAKALEGASGDERLRQFVQACGRDEVVALTTKLVAFKTVSSEAPAASSDEIKKMGRFLRAWATANGLSFRGFGPKDSDVFELTWGTGEGRLGLVFHGDVVPAPRQEWSRDPFAAQVIDGRLFGRGVEDDKGPLASALVAVAMAKAIGLQPSGHVVIAVGNGEESDWSGMKAYAAQAPKLDHWVSVDASFPVVAAQSGFVAWNLEAVLGEEKRGGAAGLWASDVRGGEFLTQIPGQATLTLWPRGLTAKEAEQEIRGAITQLEKERPEVRIDLEKLGRGGLRVTGHGRAVHSSAAEEGHNALWDLSALAAKLPLKDNGIASMLGVIARRFDGDHYGARLGLAYSDPFMGQLLVAPTLLRLEDGKVKLGVNMRRPCGKSVEAFMASLDQAASEIDAETQGRVKEGPGRHVGEPHAADTSGSLVTTLLDIYGRQRGAKDVKAISIRGGTYARLFPRAVDFGPNLPGEPYTGHAPDESISLSTLDALTGMLSEVLWRVACTPDQG